MRSLRSIFQYLPRRGLFLSCLLSIPALLAAQGPALPQVGEIAPAAAEVREMELIPVGSDSEYELGVGDRIQVIVSGHEDLSGEFVIDGDGQFYMPLIDDVDAAGLNPAELEALIVEALKPDYLVNPRVNIQVLKYRPYYLMGEVLSTGAFPYLSGMSYLKAIAIAGGFSYRAKQDHVYVIRADDESLEEIKLPMSEKVQPGDIIRVAERLF
ncbi:MAG: polysaccharide export protein [Gammaproteobacteria bacterium]|nr:polysaccharide export protein [Gammaproteobacteria bacterium]MBT8065461.1 polysaccharide export protein [Gammaproteobacteria bacterium]NNK31734.1 polysaccharide export protein [Xanthomonadales bacterium]